MLKPHHTMMDALQEGRLISDKMCREMLALMLFGTHDLAKPINLLSGGEKARVRLAQFLVDKPNVLVLDEPTNHLDIASRGGVRSRARRIGEILCVSHDRYFLDHAVERLWVLTPPGVRDSTETIPPGWRNRPRKPSAQGNAPRQGTGTLNIVLCPRVRIPLTPGQSGRTVHLSAVCNRVRRAAPDSMRCHWSCGDDRRVKRSGAAQAETFSLSSTYFAVRSAPGVRGSPTFSKGLRFAQGRAHARSFRGYESGTSQLPESGHQHSA